MTRMQKAFGSNRSAELVLLFSNRDRSCPVLRVNSVPSRLTDISYV